MSEALKKALVGGGAEPSFGPMPRFTYGMRVKPPPPGYISEEEHARAVREGRGT